VRIEANVGDRQGLIPVKPAHLLAFVGPRTGLGILGLEEVAHVEVGVAAGSGVHVHVHQPRAARGVGDDEAGLFAGLTQRTLGRCLTRLDVTAGLQPQVESLVQVQHDATFTDDECRPGHVNRIGMFVERLGECRSDLQELGDRCSFAFIARNRCTQLRTELLHDLRIGLSCSLRHGAHKLSGE